MGRKVRKGYQLKKNIRRALSVSLLAAGVVGLSACTITPEPDVMVLRYTGGSFDGSHFKECFDGGTTGDGTVNDTDITLMTSERTWNITKDNSGDSRDPIEAATKPDAKGNPGPKVKVWLKADFFLNTTCSKNSKGEWDKNSPVVKWWETVGRRYEADVDPDATPGEQSKDPGWVNSLKANLVPSELRAIQDSARLYTADELNTGANNSWANMESEIEKRLSTDLNANGSFYCGPGYDRTDTSKGCPPIRVTITDVDYSDAGVAAAREAVYQAELEAKKRLIDAQAQVDQSNILSKAAKDPNYMRLKELENQLAQVQACAQNPNCTIIVGGSNVNVNSKK